MWPRKSNRPDPFAIADAVVTVATNKELLAEYYGVFAPAAEHRNVPILVQFYLSIAARTLGPLPRIHESWPRATAPQNLFQTDSKTLTDLSASAIMLSRRLRFRSCRLCLRSSFSSVSRSLTML